MMHQWNIIFKWEQILKVYCIQHENLWKWWKVSLKHHLHFILRCYNDVRALWLCQWENCCLSECVYDCISCSFCNLKQFSWELLDILHDLLIFTALLFSDNFTLLITCLNVLYSVIDDSTVSSHSSHALDDLCTLLCSFCFDHFIWSRSESENLDDFLQCIQQLLHVFIYALTFHLLIQQWFWHLFFQSIDEFLFIHCLSVAMQSSRWLFANFKIYYCLYRQMIWEVFHFFIDFTSY